MAEHHGHGAGSSVEDTSVGLLAVAEHFKQGSISEFVRLEADDAPGGPVTFRNGCYLESDQHVLVKSIRKRPFSRTLVLQVRSACLRHLRIARPASNNLPVRAGGPATSASWMAL